MKNAINIILKYIIKSYFIFSNLISKFYFWTKGIKYGHGVRFYGIPIVNRNHDSYITIGNNVVFCSNSYATALGVNHPIILRTMNKDAVIKIGDNVGLSGVTICSAKRIEISSECMLGANVTIADTDFHPLDPDGRRGCKNPEKISSYEIFLEKNVFVGMNSIILKGVRIGQNSVIGAGSVVCSDIPADVIAAGNPCRVLKSLFEYQYQVK